MASSEIEFWRKNPPQAQVKSEQKTFVTFRPLPWYMTSCFEEKYPPEKKPSEKKPPEKKTHEKKTTLSTNKVRTKNFRKVQAFALIHDQLLWRKKNPPEKKPTRKKTHQKKTHEFWREKPTPSTNKVGKKTFVTFRPLPWYMTSCFYFLVDSYDILWKNKYHVFQVENWFLELFKNTI